MAETKINSKMIELGELTSTQVNINDGNTNISEDGSGNLQFTDTVSGTKTLADLASGNVTAVNSQTGDVTLNADDIADDATTHKFTSQADTDRLANTSGTNTGDQDLSGLTTGAASSTDNAIPKFDGTTGKVIQNSGVTIDDSNNISTSGTIDGRDISADGTKLDSIESGAQVNDVNTVFGRTGTVTSQSNDYTWAQIDKTTSDIADISNKSHTSLTDVGTNSHAQIDSHIADTNNPHSVDIDDVSPTTTKGDLIVENGTNAINLPVGTNGQVLTADSAESTGVKWADAGGGASLLDLVGYQKGGISASSSGAYLSGWGLYNSISENDGSSTNGRSSGGWYFEQRSDGTAGDKVGVYVSDPIFKMENLKCFSIKFSENAGGYTGQIFSAGFSNQPTDVFDEGSGTPFIGIARYDNESNYYFATSTTDNGQATKTNTGETYLTDRVLILVVEVISTTSVNFWLYDEDFTELASATHTTNLPTTNNLKFQLYSQDVLGGNMHGVRFYSHNLILTN